MNCTTLGIDVAKQVFRLPRVDERGQVNSTKAGQSQQITGHDRALPPCAIRMKAYGSAQKLGPQSNSSALSV